MLGHARNLLAPQRRAFSTAAGAAASKIFMYDTTLRDGTQGEGVSLSLHDKLAIAEVRRRKSERGVICVSFRPEWKRISPLQLLAVRSLTSLAACVPACAVSQRLDDMGFDFIEGGFPMSNEKDVAFFEQVQRLKLRSAVCAFGMTRRRGLEAANDPGMLALLRSDAPVCTVVGKTWDFHVTEVTEEGRRRSSRTRRAVHRDGGGRL